MVSDRFVDNWMNLTLYPMILVILIIGMFLNLPFSDTYIIIIGFLLIKIEHNTSRIYEKGIMVKK